MKMTYPIACLMTVLAIEPLSAFAGIDSGGADYQAEVSCYLEENNKNWMTLNIKNALDKNDRDFVENGLLEVGERGKLKSTKSSRLFVSLIPNKQGAVYKGKNVSMSVSKMRIADPTKVATIGADIAELYQFYPAKSELHGVPYVGYCIRNVEFYLSSEFAPLKLD